MKNIGTFLIVALMSLSIYADVGNAYRYKATVFPLSLFKNIKTIKVNENLTVDFAIAESDTLIKTDAITKIRLLEEIETEVGSRLREVSKEEFEFLNQDFISSGARQAHCTRCQSLTSQR